MAIDIDALMTRLGHFFYIGEGANTALGTTVPTRVDAALAGLGSSLGADYETVRESILDGLTALQQAGGSGNIALIQQPVQNLIQLTVQDDKPAASTLALAIAELIKQFEDGTESLDASAVGSSLSYDSGNVGNGTALISTKRADGRSCLFAYAEALHMLVGSVDDSGLATFGIVGSPLVNSLLPTWPGGSGADAQTIGKTASSSDNLVANGTFEANDDASIHLPLGWIASAATLGTRLIMSATEIQTVIMSGTPTAGFYVLKWSNAAGQSQTTVPLAFDAAQSAVQDALRALVGLESVDVVTTGTSPNFTHTITFNGVTDPAQLTSTDSTTGGTHSIAHATSTSGSANVFRGARSVEFNSNATELTTIQTPVALQPLTQYACNLFIKSSAGAPAAGVLTIDLIDGIGGSVINDQAGTANSFTFGHASFTTSFQAVNGVFRTPASLPAQAYLRIRISTAITNAVSVYLDEVFLGEMSECYVDGPSVAIFDGSTAWLEGDLITATITNDRAGLLAEWLDRVLGLRESRLMFPTKTDGSETQADSLVA